MPAPDRRPSAVGSIAWDAGVGLQLDLAVRGTLPVQFMRHVAGHRQLLLLYAPNTRTASKLSMQCRHFDTCNNHVCLTSTTQTLQYVHKPVLLVCTCKAQHTEAED